MNVYIHKHQENIATILNGLLNYAMYCSVHFVNKKYVDTWTMMTNVAIHRLCRLAVAVALCRCCKLCAGGARACSTPDSVPTGH